LHHIAVALGGRAAEEIAYGADMVSTGAANDIEKAATLARRMVNEWGMLPDSEGLYAFSQTQRDSAAQLWMDRGYELAKTVVMRYSTGWNRLTRLLLKQETVCEEEVRGCLG